jgi:DNA (cytosine-5)-methyltransferase 1
MRIAGLFAGVGGLEQGFKDALGADAHTELLCECWAPARAVLNVRFPEVDLRRDVRDLTSLPSGLDVLTVGFPCTDLTQAGRTAGIAGAQSGLIRCVFDALRLTRCRGERMPWLVVENVPNMLALDRGKAMAYLVRELEDLSYRWAYRVVDTRFTGLPQRRRRVILLASTTEDPRNVLFATDAGERNATELAEDVYGFYWTEGRRGLGWAVDAVPTIKGGSTIGIPSPPAIWVPTAEPSRRFVTPGLEDAEALQGFARGWTEVSDSAARDGARWKLIGNAVTTRVARWVAECLVRPGGMHAECSVWTPGGSWPTAAWGAQGKVHQAHVSEFPMLHPYEGLASVVNLNAAKPLSHRAITGFRRRLLMGNLGWHPRFRDDVEAYAHDGQLVLL